MTFESDKNLGGVGAILLFIGFLPFLGVYTSIISLVGLILMLVALKGLSDYYKEGGIFNNALYGVLTAIVGGIVFVAVFVTTAIGLLSALGLHIERWSDWGMFGNINWQSVNFSVIWPYITAVLLDLVLLFVFVVIAAFFLRRSMNALSAKTGIGLFGTVGLLLLIGAVLTIIAIGIIILWIDLILLAVAFFSMRPPSTQSTTTTPPSAQQTV